ncbi:zinc transporter ZntB [Woodsholea maritima]|uniref:zinc transporter ZntB n=1 Tax=Woodsholea maritima TaxID=240237 RepID=UPI00036C1677|nr:zinc transporter ZntB [Woodsholea maritima]
MSEINLHTQPLSAFMMDGHGGAHMIDPLQAMDDTIRTTNQFSFVWVHAKRDGEGDEPDARSWLEAQDDMDVFVKAALLADDTRPRCTVHGDGAIVNLRGVNLHEGADPEDMISVRLWIEAHRVVGVWLRPLYAVGDLMRAIERGQAPVSPGDLVGKLALRLADRMEPTVAALHEAIDVFEERLDEDNIENLRGDLAELRHQTIILRRFIAPQRDALTTLAIEDLSWLEEKDRSRLREAGDRTTRVLEELESVRERASVVHDQVLERRAEQMNRYTLVLSVVAAVFLPLGLLTGLLGINVGGMPGVDSPWAFPIVTLVLIVIGGLEVLLFRKMRLL